MDLSLIMKFPEGFEPNEAQTFILSQIAEGMKNGKKNFIINAPTATGKSFISKTIANYSTAADKKYIKDLNETYFTPSKMGSYTEWGTAIVTCTRALQEQYCKLFPDGDVLMGKDNYDCALDPENPCTLGKCLYNKKQQETCWKRGCCLYQQARVQAHCNKCAFYNYSLFFSLPDKPLIKEWLIFDEAAEMEDELVSAYTFEINFKTLKYNLGYVPPTPNVHSDMETYMVWVTKLQKEVNDRVQTLSNEINSTRDRKGPKFEKMKSTYARMRDLLLSLNKLIDVWDLTEWFPIHSKEAITFLPYKVDKLFWYQSKVNASKYRVFMSATIVNHKSFMRTLGLSEKDTMYIESPCALDPTKAPIVTIGEFYPTYNRKGEVYPQIADMAVKIARSSQLKNLKGLIHTQSMEMLNYVRKACDDDERFLFRGQGLSNQDILKVHESTDKPTVLVSPSMTHGIDLKGELGEFQIVLKAPYPYIGDPRVARKMKEDPDWYRDKMLGTLIQECGRCNRLQTDRAITFILDSLAANAIEKNRDILPKYFLQRYIGRKSS